MFKQLFLFLSYLTPVLSLSFISLNKTNYKQIVSQNPSLVLYYIEDDNDSMKFRSTFHSALSDAAQYGLTVGEVDCANQTVICEKVHLSSVPELRLRFGKHKTYTYHGNNTEKQILRWIDDAFLRRPRIYTDVSDLEASFSFFDHIIIGRFPSRTSPQFNTFLECGEDSKFGELYAALINENTSNITVELFHRRYELTDYFDYNGSFTKNQLLSWVKEVEKPPFLYYGEVAKAEIRKTSLPVGYYFLKLSHVEEDWMNRQIAPVAHKYKGQLLFVVVDHKENPTLTEINGIAVDDMPGFAIVVNYPSKYGKATAHYPNAPTELNPHPSIVADEIDRFIADWLDGKIPLRTRSEPVPEKQEKNVTKIVGSTFNETVFDLSKDVFVRFTAEWSDEAWHHTYEWEHLANETYGTEDLIIADFDATKNDFPPGFVIPTYPMMILFPRHLKEPFIPFFDYKDYTATVEFLRVHVPNLVYHEEEWPERPLTEEEAKKKKEEERRQEYRKGRAAHKEEKKKQRALEEEEQRLLEQNRLNEMYDL